MKQYYTHDGNRILGPYAVQELRNLLITTNTPIWYEGLPDWTTASEVPALIPYLTLGSGGPPPIKAQTEEPLPPDQQPGYIAQPKRGFGIFWLVLIGLFVILATGVFWYVKQGDNQNSLGISASQAQDELDKEFIASQEREEKKIKEQLIFKKKQRHRKNWKRYIKVDASFEEMSFLGGLENVKVKLNNNSEYLLDNVQIKVQYIKKDGAIWDTEVVALSGIEAKSTRVLDAPESFRGKSIVVTITKVQSEEMNFCYPDGGKNTNSDDPHYCK